MADMTVNIPEVVAEVTALLERYETALLAKDVDALDDTFWNSPLTIRYAQKEIGYGFDAIHRYRVERPPGTKLKERRERLVVTTFGRDAATVNLAFKVHGQDRLGHQTQMWIRFPDVGWKVVSAHVSVVPD